MNDDDKLESIWKKEYSLKEFLAPDNFKSYDELKAKLDRVLGLNGAPVHAKTTVEQAKAMPRKPAPVMADVGSAEEDDDFYDPNWFDGQ